MILAMACVAYNNCNLEFPFFFYHALTIAMDLAVPRVKNHVGVPGVGDPLFFLTAVHYPDTDVSSVCLHHFQTEGIFFADGDVT